MFIDPLEYDKKTFIPRHPCSSWTSRDWYILSFMREKMRILQAVINAESHEVVTDSFIDAREAFISVDGDLMSIPTELEELGAIIHQL